LCERVSMIIILRPNQLVDTHGQARGTFLQNKLRLT
jgi:hypothetical protein